MLRPSGHLHRVDMAVAGSNSTCTSTSLTSLAVANLWPTPFAAVRRAIAVWENFNSGCQAEAPLGQHTHMWVVLRLCFGDHASRV